MLLVTLAVAASVIAPVATTAAADDKTILLIYAEARLIPAIVTADQAIRSTIQSRWPSPVRFYTEYLDLWWFPTEGQERQLAAGALAVSMLRVEREWPDELVQRLRLLAEMFAIVLMSRHAETALEESENRFRLMADAAPVMIWMAGPDGRCIDFNRPWLEFTGRTLEQERGDGWLEGVHPDDEKECMSRYLEALNARQPFTIEYRLRGCDGLYRSVLDHGVPRVGRDGSFQGYIGSAIDVTEMEAAHQALVESTALRSAILGSIYGEVVALSRDGVVIAVNETWNRFAQENDGDPVSVGVGANYLEVCRRAAASGNPEAQQALDVLESVLEGRTQRALLEYTCHSPSRARWFAMTVEPFKRHREPPGSRRR